MNTGAGVVCIRRDLTSLLVLKTYNGEVPVLFAPTRKKKRALEELIVPKIYSVEVFKNSQLLSLSSVGNACSPLGFKLKVLRKKN